ncbi:hypothetical protein P9112_012699 [Eukaryota sp. TZLM1-RC]
MSSPSPSHPPSHPSCITPQQPVANLSKKQLKRIHKEQLRQQRKQAQKEAKKALKVQAKEEKLKKLDSMTEEERKIAFETAKQNRIDNQINKERKKQRLLQCLNDNSSLDIVLDCNYHQVMSEKEVKLTLNQIAYIYGENGQSSHPCRLTLCSFSPRLREAISLLHPHFSKWIINVNDQQFYSSTVTGIKSPIYLSADAEDVLEDVTKDNCYIVGAIVDRNRLKGQAFEAASHCGVLSRRLPIQEHVQLSSSAVLTSFHVVCLLRERFNGASWRQALEKVLPPRKVEQWLD